MFNVVFHLGKIFQLLMFEIASCDIMFVSTFVFFGNCRRSRQIGRTISHQSQDSDLESVTTEDDNQAMEGNVLLFILLHF